MDKCKDDMPFSSSNCSSDDEYLVEKIVDERRLRNGKIQYFIKWEGYHSIENTWEDATEIQRGAVDAINEWEEEKRKREMAKQVQKRKGRGTRVTTCVCSQGCSKSEGILSSGSTKGSALQSKRSNFIPYEDCSKCEFPVIGMEKGDELMIPKSPFPDELETKMDTVKTWVLQKWNQNAREIIQQHVTQVDEPLRQEIAELREANDSMVTAMKNLDLFLMHRKYPEEKLRKEIEQVKSQLKLTQGQNAAASEAIKNLYWELQEKKSEVEDMKNVLKNVAVIFSSVLSHDVSIDEIKVALPVVNEKVVEYMDKAGKLDSLRKMLTDSN